MSFQDFATIAPLVAAILTASAVLVVDLIRPNSKPARHRDGADRPGHHGARDAAGRRDPGNGVRRQLFGRCADHVPGHPVHRGRGADHPVRPGLPAPAQPAGGRVRGRAHLRDDGGHAPGRRHGPVAAVPRPRVDGAARLPARRLPQDRQLLDRGGDQVLPPRVVQLGDLPVRAGLRLGPDRDHAHHG